MSGRVKADTMSGVLAKFLYGTRAPKIFPAIILDPLPSPSVTTTTSVVAQQSHRPQRRDPCWALRQLQPCSHPLSAHCKVAHGEIQQLCWPVLAPSLRGGRFNVQREHEQCRIRRTSTLKTTLNLLNLRRKSLRGRKIMPTLGSSGRRQLSDTFHVRRAHTQVRALTANYAHESTADDNIHFSQAAVSILGVTET